MVAGTIQQIRPFLTGLVSSSASSDLHASGLNCKISFPYAEYDTLAMPNQSKNSRSKRFRPKVPLDQRKRIVKACTSCRSRKRRCVLTSSDNCQNCEKIGSPCIFEAAEDIPVSSETNPSLEDSIDYEDVATQFNRSYPGIGLGAQHAALLVKFAIDSLRRSGVELCSSKPRASRLTTEDLPTQSPTHTLARSDTIALGGYGVLAHKAFLASATEAVSRCERPDFSESSAALHSENEPTSEYENVLIKQISEDFPSRTEAEVLVSAFFSYAEANCYYFDQTEFNGQLSGLYDSGLVLSIADAKFICLTLTVFSMGSQFAYLLQPPADSEEITTEETEVPGAKCFRHAQSLIPRTLASPSLEGVLSCLLVALYALPVYNIDTCYTYLGLALRISICLGLHRKPNCSMLSPSLQEIRNRIFWTTYTIERRVGIALGYPETLQEKDIDCPLPQRQPNLDPPDSFRAERLVAYAKLALILNQAIQLRTLDKYATEEIRAELLAWKTELPAQITRLDGPTPRLNVHLQLHYCTAWIYISRSALISRVRNYLINREYDGSDLDANLETDELSKYCVQYAEQIIDLIDLLRSRRQLGRFSHTDFHSCSSATIIVLLDSILRPRLASYSKVRIAMDALRFMASSSDFARDTLKYVHNLQTVVNNVLAAMCLQGRRYLDECETHSTETTVLRVWPDSQQIRATPVELPPEHSRLCYPTQLEVEQNAGIPRGNMQNHPPGDESSDSFLDEIRTLLEDDPFTNLDLLGLDGLYTSDVFDGNKYL